MANPPDGDDPPKRQLRIARPTSYDVGYGKPPVASRYEPGQSGNPKGRPKGARNSAETAARKILQLARADARRRVSVNDGGQSRKLTTSEIIIRTLGNKAMKGDPRATRDWLDLQLMADDDFRHLEAAAARKSAEDSQALPELTAYETAMRIAFALRRALQDKSAGPDKFEDLIGKVGND